ncbi:MAG TPA: RNase H family protein [Pirellulales bacterium]|jgi:ribonuclease HI|nr:RNase H family protein [Pirellulales bacterium]
MSATAPHFLLFSESRRRSASSPPSDWRFVLQSLDGSSRLEAADAEPALGGERLELLAVVRGLEALEQPSRVTLVTPSKYVARGLSYGLSDWRENDWNWEHHGQMVPIKNRDLWQRLDRALAYHRVQCRATVPNEPPAAANADGHAVRSPDPQSTAPVGGIDQSASRPDNWVGGWLDRIAAVWGRTIAFFRRLKEWWTEMEAPPSWWRVS